MARCLRRFG
jgi:hypothetical protein